MSIVYRMLRQKRRSFKPRSQVEGLFGRRVAVGASSLGVPALIKILATTAALVGGTFWLTSQAGIRGWQIWLVAILWGILTMRIDFTYGKALTYLGLLTAAAYFYVPFVFFAQDAGPGPLGNIAAGAIETTVKSARGPLIGVVFLWSVWHFAKTITGDRHRLAAALVGIYVGVSVYFSFAETLSWVQSLSGQLTGVLGF